MVSVPIFEAKNKLPQFIHQVEEGETLGITRHGKVVAYLVGEDGLNQQSKPDKFALVMERWRERHWDCFLTDGEESDFIPSRRKSTPRVDGDL